MKRTLPIFGVDLKARVTLAVLLLGWFFVVWRVLSIGITGPFLFDDFHNLSPMGHNGGVHSLPRVLEFIFGSINGSGRPLAYLSFLIEDQHWPTFPYLYKQNNILFHLINGLLVFLLASKIFIFRGLPQAQAYLVALIAASVWVAHPIHISAQFQVVQRMTILMSTFVLLGLLSYLSGRVALSQNRQGAAFIYLVPVLGLCVVLGVLTKEPAILLPVYIAAIEFFLFRERREGRYMFLLKGWIAFMLICVVAVFATYLIVKIELIQSLYAKRDFNMTQRMLTEARVMWDYLSQIVFPRMTLFTLFHDNYPVSASLFKPVTTAIAVFSILSVSVGLFVFRTSVPLLAFAWFWFLGGHLLESTFIPLEIYFEHRNYLPSVGVVFVVAMFPLYVKDKLRKVASAGVLAYALITLFLSLNVALLWSKEEYLAKVWALENPTSLRSVQQALIYAYKTEDKEAAFGYADLILKNHPNNISVLISLYGNIDCEFPEDDENTRHLEFDAIVEKAAYGDFDHGTLNGVRKLNGLVDKGKCRTLTLMDINRLIDALLSNPDFFAVREAKSILYFEKAMNYRKLGDYAGAMSSADKAYDAFPLFDYIHVQISWSLSAGRLDIAEEKFELAKKTSVTKNLYEWFMKDDLYKAVERKLNNYKQALEKEKQIRSGAPDA